MVLDGRNKIKSKHKLSPGHVVQLRPMRGRGLSMTLLSSRSSSSARAGTVGLVGLFGVAVQNGLVLIAEVKALIEEGAPFDEALREASIGRARPKLMTACTAIFGLLPLLVLRLHGTEIERPLAVVMIGGLVTSTLFTLLALPTFYVESHRLATKGLERWHRR